MSRSQETFNKKQREKNRARKKKEKLEKRDDRRTEKSKGLEIDWDSAPENKTLSNEEEQKKAQIKQSNN